jgi:hypothetical protein
MNRVLALSMRPKSFSECVGQETLATTLQTQFSTGRIPHFYIVHGQVGAGKTTMARILALSIQTGKLQLSEQDWKSYKQYDIQEINSANRNGIDEVRSIIDMMKYQPMSPSRAKIVILDEAHQLTVPAQNALITETEDVLTHIYYIFCTSNLSKIIPALQRRAYLISPKPLSSSDILQIIENASLQVEFHQETSSLYETLVTHSITSPGLIMQAIEKYFSGIPAIESVCNNYGTLTIDTMALCRTIASGDWKQTAVLVKPITKADISMIKICVLGYFKSILLNSVNQKAICIANVITCIHNCENDCLPTFLATICLACNMIKTATLKG